MLDTFVKQLIDDKISVVNTTMLCTIVNLSPLTIQPIPVKKYITGDLKYPLIQNVKKLKEWGLNSIGAVVEIQTPLLVGNIVLVSFDKNNLNDATVLGVVS